jgi:3-methyladenine DNA glycosylase/8-oxoguanine DNA glycosylase
MMVRRTLGPLRRGRADPTYRSGQDGVWRTSQMATGPVTYRVHQRGAHEVHAQAWGPGAEEAIAWMPELLGGRDDPTGFAPVHPLLEQAHRAHPGLRVARTGRVMEALVPAVLEQKVTGQEALRAYRLLVTRFGSPAPGPAPEGMAVPPTAEGWRRIPSWEWHRAGVDPKRSRTICEATRYATRVEETVGMDREAAEARLRALPGIGVWTAAEIASRALGDADALSVGDYHLAAFVGWALLGRPVDDDGLLELLEPWRPHRYRVVRLLELSGASKPRFGPRLTIQDHRRH